MSCAFLDDNDERETRARYGLLLQGPRLLWRCPYCGSQFEWRHDRDFEEGDGSLTDGWIVDYVAGVPRPCCSRYARGFIDGFAEGIARTVTRELSSRRG